MNPSLSLFLALLVLGFSGCGNGGDEEEGSGKLDQGSDWKGDAVAFRNSFEFRDENGQRLLFGRSEEKPFTGSLSRLNANGDLSEEIYAEGLKHGLQVKHSASGARVEASFEQGLRHGDFVMYDRHGNEKSRIRYSNGKLARLPSAEEANSGDPR